MVLKTFTPGPGQYQDKNICEVSLRTNPRTVFGKSGRSLSTSNLVPGRIAILIQLALTQSLISFNKLSTNLKDSPSPPKCPNYLLSPLRFQAPELSNHQLIQQ